MKGSDGVYVSHVAEVPRSVFNVTAVCQEGKGVGLVATQDLRPGTLLLVSDPLVCLYGEPGQPPGPDEVAQSLLVASSAVITTSWLHLLSQHQGLTDYQRMELANQLLGGEEVPQSPVEVCSATEESLKGDTEGDGPYLPPVRPRLHLHLIRQ